MDDDTKFWLKMERCHINICFYKRQDIFPVMPVPFEALLPFGIIAAMFAVTGTGLSVVKYHANDKKMPRYNLDTWESQMMQRDKQLTGSIRGQTANTTAPETFKTN
ncbi:hypothetical protein BC938DRAFT_474523, partial [Jimgerdemannia flammicorona]